MSLRLLIIGIIMNMQLRRLLFAFISMICCGETVFSENYSLASPDKALKVDIVVGNVISYSVYLHGKALMKDNSLSLSLEGKILGDSPSVKKALKTYQKEYIKTFNYRCSDFNTDYNELNISFKGGYSLIFRAYDEGIAYRWNTEFKDSIIIKDETADFNFSDDYEVYLPHTTNPKGDQYAMAFQNIYMQTKLSNANDKEIAFLPVTVDCGNNVKVTLLESDLESYPGMFVRTDNENLSLKADFACYPSEMASRSPRAMTYVKKRHDYIAKTSGNRFYPWRIMAVTERDEDMPVNNMVYALASPNRIGDISWVQGGKVAWDWWSDWGITGVDFKAGINMETYKHYIDFAAENGLEFIVLDEGWYDPGKGDMLTVVPELNLPELVDYGKSRGVNLILWAVFNVLDNQLEEACRKYSAMGIRGFKIDFLDRDDQTAVEMLYRIAETAARYHLTLDLHGFYKPTGVNRTYPNIINFESVFGMEEMKWSTVEKDMMEYDVTMPFIRMMAGPVDYTPGAMRNATKKDFKPIYYNPMSQGTRCHQLAAYIVHDSPLTMLSDNPQAYRKEKDCLDFIASVPNIGIEETKVLQGKLGEYIVVARRIGNDWYIGGMTDWNARTIKLDLSFLADGLYRSKLFTDGINAYKNASDYRMKEQILHAGKELKIEMASGGGFAMSLKHEPLYKSEVIDTLDFNIYVAADKASVDFLGGSEAYQKKLDIAFHKVNRKWNGYDRNNFNHYYRFIPHLENVYEGSSMQAQDAISKKIDKNRFDLMFMIDGKCDFPDEKGNFACGGDSEGFTIVSIKNGDKSNGVKDFAKLNWEGFAHELGHYRGVTDLYASQIRAEKNPVNHRTYMPEKCLMLYSSGNDTWSTYAVNIINRTAKSKQLSKDFPNLFKSLFPENIRVSVFKDGKPLSGIDVRIYGTRALYYDVITPAYRTFRTDSNGMCTITDVPDIYCNPSQPGRPDELPWGRWFGLLMEVEYNGVKKYEWLPEYKVQNVSFEGKDTYLLSFNF